MVSHRFLSGALGAALIGFTSPALAEDVFPTEFAQGEKSIALEPAARWSLLNAESSCKLTRRFGTEDNLHLLVIEQSAPANSFSLIAVGPAFRYYRAGKSISLGMQADNPMIEFELPPTGTYADVGKAVILAGVIVGETNQETSSRLSVPGADESELTDQRFPTSAKLDLGEAEKIERVVFGRRGKAVSFETGKLTQAFAALNACTSEKLVNWGLAPEKHENYTPPVLSNQRAIGEFLEERYSQAARVRGEQAIFRVRVNVEVDGSVSECEVNSMTTTDKLNSPACDAMGIAQFEPALDAQGNPMRSFYASTISYRISG